MRREQQEQETSSHNPGKQVKNDKTQHKNTNREKTTHQNTTKKVMEIRLPHHTYQWKNKKATKN